MKHQADSWLNETLPPVRALFGCLAAALLVIPSAAQAQAGAYPDKPIRLVVPFAPGGATDSAARFLAQSLSANLGQQVVIDNRGGAGGLIGIDIAAHSAPDGYTLLMSHAGFAAMPALYRKVPFDPVKDFAGVITAVSGIYVLVLNPSVPFKTVKELIVYAKANPGKLAYGSSGSGSTIHLAAELFKSKAQIDMLHVPYKGAAIAMTDVVGGQLQLMFGAALNALPLLRAGKLKGLAVTSSQRSSLVPDLPTVAESGLEGYEVVGWYGFAAPVKTPKSMIAKINAETNRFLKVPEFNERVRGIGMETVGSMPEEATALIKSEVERWTKVIRDAGIRAD
jgi:tripartite-type tricarboxylate transporter receptor subunit TctC